MGEREIWIAVKAVLGIAMGFMLGLHHAVQALLILQVLDIAAGTLVAIHENRLSSRVAFRSLTKKAAILIVVATGHVLEDIAGVTLVPYLAGYFCVHEALSILEHSERMGVRIPRRLRYALDVMRREALNGRADKNQ